MLNFENRLNSFNNWPRPVSARDLAEAGFFAIGHPSEAMLQDITRCVSCGCYAANWIRPCDPLVEHNRMSPHCDYAQMKLILRELAPAAPKKKVRTKPVKRDSPRVKKATKKLFVSASKAQ